MSAVDPIEALAIYTEIERQGNEIFKGRGLTIEDLEARQEILERLQGDRPSRHGWGSRIIGLIRGR